MRLRVRNITTGIDVLLEEFDICKEEMLKTYFNRKNNGWHSYCVFIIDNEGYQERVTLHDFMLATKQG